jgi:hypothetical protein
MSPVTFTDFKGLFGKWTLEMAHSNIPILNSLEVPFIKKKNREGWGNE